MGGAEMTDVADGITGRSSVDKMGGVTPTDSIRTEAWLADLVTAGDEIADCVMADSAFADWVMAESSTTCITTKFIFVYNKL